MKRSCDVCSTEYEAKRETSRYCSAKCRNRHQRGAGADPKPEAESLAAQASVGLMASTLMELAQAGRENTALGQAALLLAYRLEHSQADTGSSIASMVKQHSATLAEAVKGAVKTVDPVDELRRRREQRRVAG